MKPRLQLPKVTVWQRDLPAEARILISPGASVQPDSALAECQTAVAPIVIDLSNARALIEPGQSVHAGVVVAERKKLLGHGDEIRSPVAGTVVRVTDAELLLQPPPLTSTVAAHLPGSVAAVRGTSGIDLEGCYAILRGRGQLTGSIHGHLGEQLAIVVEPLTITQWQALGGQGMQAVIAPSWADDPEPKSWLDSDGPPVFLTEPRSGQPMAPPIAQVLQAHLGQPASIQPGSPPRVAFASASASEPQRFGPGSWVRLADGRNGKIKAIGAQPRFFPSGLHAAGAQVDLGDSVEWTALDSLDWVA